MRIIFAPILVALALTPPARSQEKAQSRTTVVYRVEFNIHDSSNVPVNAGRRYSTLVITNNKNNFDVGDKIPYSTGSGSQGKENQY
jgi:hypothetical protein